MTEQRTMDKPEIESLDYKPEQPKCKMCNDTGRTKVICRPLDEEIPQYVPCKYCEKGKEYFDKVLPDWKKQVRKVPEQPDTNAMIFKQLNGYQNMSIELLGQLKPQTEGVESCIITLKSWQDNNLKHLRGAFE